MSRHFNMNEIDVLNIPTRDLPLFVLSSNKVSPFSQGIQLWTSSIWNHAMWMVRPQRLITQGLTLREVPIQHFLRGKHSLKFWYNPDWTQEDKILIRRKLREQLNRPLYNRVYDWFGIVGQGIRNPVLQFNNRMYCSEMASEVFSAVEPYMDKHPSPAELDHWCQAARRMKVYGEYYVG